MSVSFVDKFDSDKPSEDWIFDEKEIEVTGTILGRGAFGEVRIAKWRGIEIAAKRLHVIHSEGKTERRQDLYANIDMNREIALLSKLRHPNLLLFFELFSFLLATVLLAQQLALQPLIVDIISL